MTKHISSHQQARDGSLLVLSINASSLLAYPLLSYPHLSYSSHLLAKSVQVSPDVGDFTAPRRCTITAGGCGCGASRSRTRSTWDAADLALGLICGTGDVVTISQTEGKRMKERNTSQSEEKDHRRRASKVLVFLTNTNKDCHAWQVIE